MEHGGGCTKCARAPHSPSTAAAARDRVAGRLHLPAISITGPPLQTIFRAESGELCSFQSGTGVSCARKLSMRGNLTRQFANHCAFRALTSALPPASRGLDRNFCTTTALALAAWSFGLAQQALAQACGPLVASGSATCTSAGNFYSDGINYSTVNTPIFVTLQSGVNVVIHPVASLMLSTLRTRRARSRHQVPMPT